MAAQSPLLKLENVTKSYTAPDGSETPPVLSNICLTVEKGETVAIIGPSGSGKSTLLNIVGCLDSLTRGTVFLSGEDISALPKEKISQLRNQEIGFIFQQHHLLPQLTVLENVLIPCLAGHLPARMKEQEARARDLLATVGLKERMTYWPGQLSGGERQRVAVVRALINQPQLLLADEPTGSLDHKASLGIADLLVVLNQRENVALMIVTHAMELANRMQKVFEIRDAELHAVDTNR
jgi:ABC-type lipoprotein export system ATPase subunit